jgi:hypothetical protein
MYATVRRSEGIGMVRSEEVRRKIGESLLPSRAGDAELEEARRRASSSSPRRPVISQRPKRIFREAFHESAAAW